MINHAEARARAENILQLGSKTYNWIEQMLAAAYLDLCKQACPRCQELGRACPACIAARLKSQTPPTP